MYALNIKIISVQYINILQHIDNGQHRCRILKKHQCALLKHLFMDLRQLQLHSPCSKAALQIQHFERAGPATMTCSFGRDRNPGGGSATSVFHPALEFSPQNDSRL